LIAYQMFRPIKASLVFYRSKTGNWG